jgi:hypothetical protein
MRCASGSPFVFLPLVRRVREKGWIRWQRRNTSVPSRTAFHLSFAVVDMETARLGFSQFRFSHTHLVLTTQEDESFSLRGLFLACYGPPSLSRLQPSRARVSKVDTGLSNSPDRGPQIPLLTRRNFVVSLPLQKGIWLL